MAALPWDSVWTQTAAIAEEVPPILIQSHLPMPLLTEAQHSPKLVQYQCPDPLTPKFHPPNVPWAHLCPYLDLQKRQGWKQKMGAPEFICNACWNCSRDRKISSVQNNAYSLPHQSHPRPCANTFPLRVPTLVDHVCE